MSSTQLSVTRPAESLAAYDHIVLCRHALNRWNLSYVYSSGWKENETEERLYNKMYFKKKSVKSYIGKVHLKCFCLIY